MSSTIFRHFPLLFFVAFSVCVLFFIGAGSGEAIAAEAVAVAADESNWLDRFLELVPDWIQLATLLITIASAVTALTPTPKDDGIVLGLKKLLDLIALNVGKAKNAESTKDRDRIS